jgi:hypothetical protein
MSIPSFSTTINQPLADGEFFLRVVAVQEGAIDKGIRAMLQARAFLTAAETSPAEAPLIFAIACCVKFAGRRSRRACVASAGGSAAPVLIDIGGVAGQVIDWLPENCFKKPNLTGTDQRQLNWPRIDSRF